MSVNCRYLLPQDQFQLPKVKIYVYISHKVSSLKHTDLLKYLALEAKCCELLRHAPSQLQDLDLPDPTHDPDLLACIMLKIDWIEDIKVQVFCINFLAEPNIDLLIQKLLPAHGSAVLYQKRWQ